MTDSGVSGDGLCEGPPTGGVVRPTRRQLDGQQEAFTQALCTPWIQRDFNLGFSSRMDRRNCAPWTVGPMKPFSSHIPQRIFLTAIGKEIKIGMNR